MSSRQSAGKHGQYIFKLLLCLWSWTVMSQHKKSIIVSIINLWSSWCYVRWSYYSPCSSFNNYPRSKITTRAKMIWYPWSRKKTDESTLVMGGFIGSFDAPWSEWFWITDPDLDLAKETNPKSVRMLCTNVRIQPQVNRYRLQKLTFYPLRKIPDNLQQLPEVTRSKLAFIFKFNKWVI